MRVFLLAAMILMAAGRLDAGAGTAGNGADWANQFFARGAYKIESILRQVLNKHAKEFTETERDTIQKIVDGMPLELARSAMVEVKASNPSFFIDGIEKIAYTGSSPGTKIYINENLILDRTGDGAIRPLTYFQQIQILVHELAHHHGVQDHQWLDQLGAKVAGIFDHDQSISLGSLHVKSCRPKDDAYARSTLLSFRAIQTTPEETIEVGFVSKAYASALMQCEEFLEERRGEQTLSCRASLPGVSYVSLRVNAPPLGSSQTTAIYREKSRDLTEEVPMLCELAL